MKTPPALDPAERSRLASTTTPMRLYERCFIELFGTFWLVPVILENQNRIPCARYLPFASGCSA
jgi:hypothetical protein